MHMKGREKKGGIQNTNTIQMYFYVRSRELPCVFNHRSFFLISVNTSDQVSPEGVWALVELAVTSSSVDGGGDGDGLLDPDSSISWLP